MTVMAIKKRAPAVKEPGLEQEAVDVLGRMQSAMRDLIKATPGMTKRAADLTRTLGIHSKLAWQVHRLAHADDPLTQVGNVPGPASIERFLEATAKRGAPASRVEAVRAAQREFEDLIRAHAGNRGEFDSMLSGFSTGGSEQMDLSHKRAAFKAQSHIWGLQADTHLSIALFHAAEDDQFTAVYFRGFLGLRWLRRDAPWIVSRVHPPDATGAMKEDSFAAEALDPAGETVPGISLVREFCTLPLPRFRSVLPHSDLINVELEKTGLGKSSAMTCIFGNILRRAGSRFRDQERTQQIEQTIVRVPSQVLIRDILVHQDVFGEISPEVVVYGDQRGGDLTPSKRPCDRLPLREAVVYLGRGLSVMQTPEVPRYIEMIDYACNRMGWDAKKFDVYRCRVEYPVMPSSVVVQFDLPEKPPPEEPAH
jgi:hypothetical protein